MQWGQVEANLPKTLTFPKTFTTIYGAFPAQIALNVQAYINSYVHITAINNQSVTVYSSNSVYPAYIFAIGIS